MRISNFYKIKRKMYFLFNNSIWALAQIELLYLLGEMMENRIVAKNPTAYHNYNIIDSIEAGIVLYGTEIKSIRNGKVNLKDSYAVIEKNREVYVYSMSISPYENGNIYNKDPLRPKKLLLNRREINKLVGMVSQKGYSLIPINLYFKGNTLKMKLGIGTGKKLYDKREDLKKKDAERNMARYKN